MIEKQRKNIWILSLTPVTDEPRVRRQAQACLDKGWNVIVFGFPGRTEKPAGWTLFQIMRHGLSGATLSEFQSMEDNASSENLFQKKQWYSILLSKVASILPKKYSELLRKLIRYSLKSLNLKSMFFVICSRWSDRAAIKYYWSQLFYVNLRTAMLDVLATRPELKPDLLIGHDYFTAPLMDDLAKKSGASFSIDLHEYARDQFMHNHIWRLFLRPWVNRIQKLFLPQSKCTTTVCDGIADLLAQDYSNITRPIVVRSISPYVKMELREPSKPIRVLYHGIVYHTRGLGLAVESMPLWRPEFEFIIRGPGPDVFFDELLQKARRLGVEHRLKLEPPVLFHDIIPSANQCDIGYFVHQDISPQKRFTLPNKFFEYTMAGLALCVSDLPEMKRLVNQYDLGHLVDGFSKEAIAESINRFTPQNILEYKKNALKASEELCWEKESTRMTDAYDHILNLSHQHRVAA